MFLEKNVRTNRKNEIMIGYDLGEENAQISFCRMDHEEPESAAVRAGEEQYDFPSVLGRCRESNQWTYGKEALRMAEEGRGILVDKLLLRARAGEAVTVGEESFDPTALLALFMKKSLSLVGITSVSERIAALTITVEVLDDRTVEVLTQAASLMQLQAECVSFQSYAESFYQYMIHQPEDLWQSQVLLYDLEADRMKIYRMLCNRRSSPMTAFVEDGICQGMEKNDEVFLELIQKSFRDEKCSSVYLIGPEFEEEWYPESLRYLCRGRRVFRGNNLYSKGACYRARSMRMPQKRTQQYLFLGKDKLKANIGMRVLRRGEESYLALLDAGSNWFDAKKQCEFMIESGNSFSIVVTPLNEKEGKNIEIVLNDLPNRRERTSRIRMSLSMRSEKKVLAELQDLGFGEIYPATWKVWQKEFEI